MIDNCLRCDAELTEDNWYPSLQKKNEHICKECTNKRNRLWRKANQDKVKAMGTRADRRRGICPFNENKECGLFLGCHIAERVLSHVFRDVEKMPFNNSGYDFICNHGKKIDAKSSCLLKNGSWSFHINHNTTADYFICMAFDNLEDLNPLHVWLIPGSAVNHLMGASIRPTTINKWDAYALDISKVSECCDTMKTAVSA